MCWKMGICPRLVWGGVEALAYAEASSSIAAPCLIALGVMVIGISVCNFLGIDRREFIAHDDLGFDVAKPLSAASAVPSEDDPAYQAIEPIEALALSPPELIDIIQRKLSQASSRFGLSRREIDVLAYLVRGRNAAHIAKGLYVSSSTVRSHIARIYAKAGVRSQQELINLVEGIGISDEDDGLT